MDSFCIQDALCAPKSITLFCFNIWAPCCIEVANSIHASFLAVQCSKVNSCSKGGTLDRAVKHRF